MNGKSNRENRAAVPAAPVEPDTGHEPLGAEEAPGSDTRVDIRVISYRSNRHDPDGVSVKAVLDGLVRRGVLPDDSAKEVRSVTFESIKAPEEKTVIEIQEVTP